MKESSLLFLLFIFILWVMKASNGKMIDDFPLFFLNSLKILSKKNKKKKLRNFIVIAFSMMSLWQSWISLKALMHKDVLCYVVKRDLPLYLFLIETWAQIHKFSVLVHTKNHKFYFYFQFQTTMRKFC